MRTRSVIGLMVVVIMTLLRAGPLQGADTLTIAGAGATFPQPLYSALFEAVAKQKQMLVRYDGVGSGDGIRALIERRVDFAGTDAFMSPAEIGKAGANVVQVPTCMGAVVLTYNLPGNIPIRLSPAVIADIFLGQITKWNDTRIMALNPNLRLSDLSISVIRRSDSSGTTAIFTEYLAKVSQAWKEKVGSGKSITWPVGQGAKGNPGVAGMVSKVIGSLGYVELIYALGNNMKIAEVQNRSGQFVKPSVESVSLAAEVKIPDDTNVSLTDTEAPSGYPISGFTWIAVYQEQQYNGRSEELARELVNLISWMIHEGQSIARQLHYAPLQKEAVQKSERLLQSIQFNGRPLLTP